MARYRTYGQVDDAPQLDGDAGFVGVDARRDPRQIEPGLCAMAKNKVFDQGVAETRPGFASVGWGTEWGMALPTDMLLKAATSSADYGTLDGEHVDDGVFKVQDRGVKEFEYRTCYRIDGRVNYSVGDVVNIAMFSNSLFNNLNSEWVISYAGDSYFRVIPDEADWDAAPASEALGNGYAEWQGTVSFDEAQGFGSVFGAAVFSDPNGQEGTLVALADRVLLLRSGQLPQSIALPSGETLVDTVRFVQCFDRVIMFRGVDATPLVWNPHQDFEVGLGEFDEVAELGAGSPGFLEPIPNGIDGVEFNGRLFVVYSRDQIAVSDLYDYTHYDPVFQAFRINEGSDDSIVKIMPFGEQRMLVFFDQSIWMLDNVYGDLSEVRGDLLTRERGAVAADAIVQMGPDIWFLGEGGVWSVAQTEQAQLQASAEPISAPIRKLMARVNWGAVDGAQAVSHDGRFYLAVPLDAATYSNALLVYDQVSMRWWGYWTSECLDVQRMIKTDHAGNREVVVVNGDALDEAAYHGAVLVVGEGYKDEVYGNHLEIEDELITRGYSFGNVGRKRSREVEVVVSTWNPSFEITHLVNGVGEERSLTGGAVTRDREKYSVFSKADYDVTNVDDDHAEPYREDYSVRLGGALEGWCGALVNDDQSDLEVRLYMPVDYSDITLINAGQGTLWDDLHPSVAGQVIVTQGFLSPEMNRSWTVAQDSSVGTPEAVCVVTAAEKLAIISSCNSLYTKNGDGEYIMPGDPGGDDKYIKSYDVGNALTNPLHLGSGGVDVQLHQQVERKLKLRQAGAWSQLKFTNTQGRCLVHGVQIAGDDARRSYRESH